jgi:hypothetical protein
VGNSADITALRPVHIGVGSGNVYSNGASMKKIYYVKEGRKYVPVAEYDNDLMDSFHKGNHLVMVYPGGTSRRFNIEPALAPMIAAGRVAEDAVCSAMMKASELKPQRTPITPAQQKAWQALANAFGDELCTLNGASVRDIAEAGVKAMQTEADKLLQHEAVKQAYDHFMFVAKLVHDEDNTKK